MQATASVDSYKVLSPSSYRQVNKSVIRLAGVIRSASLVIRPAGKLVRCK